MKTDLRSHCTGKAFGHYFRVDAVLERKPHEIYLHASRYEISPTGVLTLFNNDDKPYRSFHPTAWRHIAATSLFDGSEMWEEHDWVEKEETTQ